ncbi:MAG TPA: hypothetical protein VFG07_09960 [Thermoplasmata archaeon]|nr:hypothetical protein [Thermoplasmata archaeon]
MKLERPVCSWMGLSPDGEREEPCGKPASYYVEMPSGHRVFSCLEHLTHAKANAETGALVHRVPGHYPPEGHEIFPTLA